MRINTIRAKYPYFLLLYNRLCIITITELLQLCDNFNTKKQLTYESINDKIISDKKEGVAQWTKTKLTRKNIL